MLETDSCMLSKAEKYFVLAQGGLFAEKFVLAHGRLFAGNFGDSYMALKGLLIQGAIVRC